MVLIITGLFGALLTLLSLTRWRIGLITVGMLTVLEGAIRKWLLPQYSDYVYVAKDYFLVLTVIGWLLSRDRESVRLPHGVTALIVLYAIWCAFMTLPASQASLPLALLGVKGYLIYIPLLWLLPEALRDERDVRWMFGGLALLCAVNFLLALAQVSAPAGSVLNAYARQSEYVSVYGSDNLVRVTGTFSYITGFTVFMMCASLLIFSHSIVASRLSVSALVVLVGCFLSFLMSGSRLPVYTWVLLTPVIFLVLTRKRLHSVRLYAAGLAVVVLMVAIAATRLGVIFESWTERATTERADAQSRLFGNLTEPLRVAAKVGLVGEGIGFGHQAAYRLLGQDSQVLERTAAYGLENEPGRVMAETGIVGFALHYGLKLILILWGYRVVTRLQGAHQTGLALGAFLVIVALLAFPTAYMSTAGVLFWASAGLLVVAQRLEAIEAQASPMEASALHARTA